MSADKYLLTGHNPDGSIDEIIGTFDTPELAQAFVMRSTGYTRMWRCVDEGEWRSGRWHVVALPHNADADAVRVSEWGVREQAERARFVLESSEWVDE